MLFRSEKVVDPMPPIEPKTTVKASSKTPLRRTKTAPKTTTPKTTAVKTTPKTTTPKTTTPKTTPKTTATNPQWDPNALFLKPKK